MNSIKEIKNSEKPECYTPNNDPYPLCKGNNNSLHNCEDCCLYEDMIEGWCEDY
jgi:hypothetical protein